MNVTASIARDDAITEALRAATDALGDDEPTQQALHIIAAIKRLRSPVRVTGSERVDYLERVQRAARAQWHATRKADEIGPVFAAVAGTDTPIGRLKAVTWRTTWRTGRVAWMTEYYLKDDPITLAEIRAAGLAQRPTMRCRQKKGTRNHG